VTHLHPIANISPEEFIFAANYVSKLRTTSFSPCSAKQRFYLVGAGIRTWENNIYNFLKNPMWRRVGIPPL
jgi:hypothetical protein